jgi:L-lactate dehydrogenase
VSDGSRRRSAFATLSQGVRRRWNAYFVVVPVVLGLIEMVAIQTELRLLLFPSLASFAYLLFTRPVGSHATWRGAVVGPTVGASIGSLGSSLFEPGFLGVLVVAFVAMVAMRLMHVTSAPVLAVAILPLVFRVHGFEFPISILLATTALFLVFLVWRRTLPQGLIRLPTDPVAGETTIGRRRGSEPVRAAGRRGREPGPTFETASVQPRGAGPAASSRGGVMEESSHDHARVLSAGTVGIVGVGNVGSACAFSLFERGSCHEIVLVDRNEQRAEGIAVDMHYGAPLSPSLSPEVRGGGYEQLEGADVVLITAGVNEKTGGATDRNDPRGRLRLLAPNAEVYRDIVPQVVAVAPHAVLVAVTDPPDPLADLTRTLAGHDRVFSTGTLLDSLRFRVHIARELGVHPASVDARVIGEHGTSQVPLWSSARIGGSPIERALERRRPGTSLEQLRENVERDVRYANITIIEGTGASRFGIGTVCARLSEAVLRDEHTVLPVAPYSERYRVSVSLPSLLTRDGAEHAFEPEMSQEEREGFERSVETLRQAGEEIDAFG